MKITKKKEKEIVEPVTISITSSQHQKLYDISEKNGLSISKYVRNWIDTLNNKYLVKSKTKKKSVQVQ